MASKNQTRLRLLMLGDSCVGKTALIFRYSSGELPDNWMTIGFEFRIMQHEYKGQPISLQLWDMAGQDRFKSIIKPHWRGSHGVMLVYSVTDEASFANCTRWIQDIRNHVDENVVLVLVGNKCDLTQERLVSTQEGADLAAKFNLPFFETSAKADIRVAEAYKCLIDAVCKQVFDHGGAAGGGASVRLKDGDGADKKQDCCY